MNVFFCYFFHWSFKNPYSHVASLITYPAFFCKSTKYVKVLVAAKNLYSFGVKELKLISQFSQPATHTKFGKGVDTNGLKNRNRIRSIAFEKEEDYF